VVHCNKEQWPENLPAVDLVDPLPRMPRVQGGSHVNRSSQPDGRRHRARDERGSGDGKDGKSMNRLLCFLIGHTWMENGHRSLRLGGRWLGTSSDWQKCFRCGRWELLA